MATQQKYCVYKHTSPSGKAYIGQTNNFRRRNSQHKYCGCCPIFSAAIKKYGWDMFTHEILEDGLTLEEANVFEELLIAEHGTLVPNGYNVRIGGLNTSPTKETREKIAKTLMGHSHSDEARAKISEAGKGRIPAYLIAGGVNPLAKTYVVTFPTGGYEIVTGLPSFCALHGLVPAEMTGVAKGRKQHHRGFRCAYYTGDIPIYGPIVDPKKKRYSVTSPAGITSIILGLQEFCRENGLLATNMVKVAKGKHSTHLGWNCRYAE